MSSGDPAVASRQGRGRGQANTCDLSFTAAASSVGFSAPIPPSKELETCVVAHSSPAAYLAECSQAL